MNKLGKSICPVLECAWTVVNEGLHVRVVMGNAIKFGAIGLKFYVHNETSERPAYQTIKIMTKKLRSPQIPLV